MNERVPGNAAHEGGMSHQYGWWAAMARVFWLDQHAAAIADGNIPAARDAQAQYDRYARAT